jgi:riboflavin synthase
MFTGIIKGMGRVLDVAETGGDRRITIGFDPQVIAAPATGASIAVNGACVTATAAAADRFTADISRETLSKTTFGRLAPDDRVNLEPSLALGQTLDGHWVSGHVDGVGRVVSVTPVGRSLGLLIEVPAELARYVAPKGSIAVDGISLTTNTVDGARFTANIVPHTREMTTIAEYVPGSAVNIEVDIVARYLERLLQARPAGLDMDKLKHHGFASDH